MSAESFDFDFNDAPEVAVEAPRMVCALGVSHADAPLAANWRKWTSFLCSLEGGSQQDSTLLIMGTQSLTPQHWAQLRAAIIKTPGMFNIEGAVLPDDNENGYPISASHLFLRTMEHCEKTFPGSPVLWVEADSVPMRPGWFSEIEAEYGECGKPFMGHLEAKSKPVHMPGVAVYPPDWRDLSPRLAGVLSAPDIAQWGSGKGQAFDIYAAPEIVPKMAQAKTLQLIWRPPQFTKDSLKTIKPEAALFHQCKTGALINLLGSKYPTWKGTSGKPTKVFAARGHLYRVQVGPDVFQVSYRIPRFPGGWWSVIKPRNSAEEAKLTARVESGIVEEVDENLIQKQAKKWSAMRGQTGPVKPI